MKSGVAVVGAGLAGCEAAWQLAARGIAVDLHEMRPARMTPAHRTPGFAELVCSNSFKSLNPQNAHGLLKAEMALLGSMVLQAAHDSAVPAGQALAVDRESFSARIGERIESSALIRVVRAECTDVRELLDRYQEVVVATGPLTSDAFSMSLAALLGEGHLFFHDAIAPTLVAESIDTEIAFRASRYDKGDADYLNCPLDRDEYFAFVEAVGAAETIALHDFETLRPFEGCLPIEVMVARGPLTLAYGPMKPVGLTDPRTERRPFAVVQLRQENHQGTLYGMVGFQTKMTWPEQRRIFRTIPGLANAEFARLGSLHRNTFLASPLLLDEALRWRGDPRLSFAGQITGVEGYMESAAMGLYVGQSVARRMLGLPPLTPSPKTMTGALVRYVTASPPANFQPMNASFGLLEPAPGGMSKADRKAFHVRRSLEEIERLRDGKPATPVEPAASF